MTLNTGQVFVFSSVSVFCAFCTVDFLHNISLTVVLNMVWKQRMTKAHGGDDVNGAADGQSMAAKLQGLGMTIPLSAGLAYIILY